VFNRFIYFTNLYNSETNKFINLKIIIMKTKNKIHTLQEAEELCVTAKEDVKILVGQNGVYDVYVELVYETDDYGNGFANHVDWKTSHPYIIMDSVDGDNIDNNFIDWLLSYKDFTLTDAKFSNHLSSYKEVMVCDKNDPIYFWFTDEPEKLEKEFLNYAVAEFAKMYSVSEYKAERFIKRMYDNGKDLDDSEQISIRVYIESTDTTEDPELFIIDSDNITESNACKGYDMHGQEVGCENAGCYSLGNHVAGCQADLIAYIEKQLAINLEVDGYIDDIKEIFDYYECDSSEKVKIKKLAKEWLKDNESHTEHESYDYWDGHNWRTKRYSNGYGWPNDFEEIDEKLEEDILDAYFQYDSHIEGATKTEKIGKYEFRSSRFADDFAMAWVTKLES